VSLAVACAALTSVQRITIPAGAHGTLRGSNILAADGHIKARRFLQVPYARAPVGELRWRKPAPLPDDADWSGIDGEQFGNVTAQPRYEITKCVGLRGIWS
jgi:carboxylesterase type B